MLEGVLLVDGRFGRLAIEVSLPALQVSDAPLEVVLHQRIIPSPIGLPHAS
jgi:hypothetical protein